MSTHCYKDCSICSGKSKVLKKIYHCILVDRTSTGEKITLK